MRRETFIMPPLEGLEAPTHHIRQGLLFYTLFRPHPDTRVPNTTNTHRLTHSSYALNAPGRSSPQTLVAYVVILGLRSKHSQEKK